MLVRDLVREPLDHLRLGFAEERVALLVPVVLACVLRDARVALDVVRSGQGPDAQPRGPDVLRLQDPVVVLAGAHVDNHTSLRAQEISADELEGLPIGDLVAFGTDFGNGLVDHVG